MPLRPFDVADAATVAGWARTAEEAFMWCGHAGWPVPADTVKAWSTEDPVSPFGLYAEPDGRSASSRAGFDGRSASSRAGFDGRSASSRAGFDGRSATRHRGHSAGRQLVAELVERAASPTIVLRVHPHNAVALRCYAGAGFVRVDAAREAEWNELQPVAYVWLTRP